MVMRARKDSLASAASPLLCGIIRSMSLSLLLIGMSAGPIGASPGRPAIPSELQLQIMIKTTLIAFNQANLTGNYTLLRDLAAPSFQQMHTAARLSEIFQSERNKNIDISPVVLLRPNLVRAPSIDARGRLHLEGYFPSNPQAVYFVLVFQDVAEQWRLAALGVQTSVPAPAAASHSNRNQAIRSRSVTAGLTATGLAQSWARRWPYWTYGKGSLR